MQKKGSFPGRSASMSKISVTCVERPSSVHAGWSLLPTACKMTAGQGSILLKACFMPFLTDKSLLFCMVWLIKFSQFSQNK